MNWFRKLIARAFPPEAGMGYNSLRWGAVPSTPNPTPQNDPISRARAEQEVRNSALARRITSAWVGGLVAGSGISPMLRSPELRRLWADWTTMPDQTGRLDWVGLLQQISETMIVSGECFVVLSISETVPGVPLALQVLGPEFLDTSKSDGSHVISGIEFEGPRRSAYWLHKAHPAVPGSDLRSVRVDAADVLHVYRAGHPGQQRGESWFLPVLYLLRMLREFLEADLVRQKTSALLCGFLRSPSGQLNPFGNAANSPISLEPGTMTLLPSEAEVTFSSPQDHGAAFDPFVRHIIRMIFAGMNLPYELSGDLSAVTFASGRAGILEFRRQVEAIQYGVLIPQLAQPILDRWLQLAGALEYQGATADRPRWACPSPQALDARMEVQTDILRVRAGFASRREVVESNGWNISDVDAEIADDQQRARGLGLVLDVDSQHTQQGQQQPIEQETTP